MTLVLTICSECGAYRAIDSTQCPICKKESKPPFSPAIQALTKLGDRVLELYDSRPSVKEILNSLKPKEPKPMNQPEQAPTEAIAAAVAEAPVLDHSYYERSSLWNAVVLERVRQREDITDAIADANAAVQARDQVFANPSSQAATDAV